MHIETATQFLPVIRLDGYYILADLIGVPDLFSRMGPVLASLIPGRPTHPRVKELKPFARRTIILWVVIVVPSLLYWLIGFIIVMPYVLPVVWRQLIESSQTVGTAATAGHVAEAILGAVQILLLLLPWAGGLLLLGMLASGPARWVWAHCCPARLQGRRL
jgi:putative peptide zinc metalloprotease protein